MIAVTVLSAIVVSAASLAPASGFIGMVKSYGPAVGTAQPYEPVGPFVDGVLFPSFLSTQDLEWQGLKQGTIDVYDFPMTATQLNDYTTNICVPSPDLPSNVCTDSTGSHTGFASIQHEITIATVNAFDKWEIDLQTVQFPTNVLQFRQALAWALDKAAWAAQFDPGLAVPVCTTMPAGLSPSWTDPSLLASACAANHVYGWGDTYATRIATANAILDTLGFTVATSGTNTGFRVNNRVGCASDIGGCGTLISPLFYARSDDPLRTDLGNYLEGIMAAPACVGTACTTANGLGIKMVAGCTFGAYPSAQNYCLTTRSALKNAVFIVNNFNIYTGGWSLTRDPTGPISIYDPLGIFPGGVNYNHYNDPVYTAAERGLLDAVSQSAAFTFAYAAEKEYNATLPAIDVWSTSAPFAYRNYHVDTDTTLNGLAWEGISLQQGVGFNGLPGFTFLNAQLIGAPVHSTTHPVYIKYGIKADVLDSPNPFDSDFLYDQEVYLQSTDYINNLAQDDTSFAGDLPWVASLPTVTNVNSGAAFPDGSICVPDAPALGCQYLSYQMRPDLTFAASLDGSIPSLPMTANDVAFSALLARDSPTSFIGSTYIDLQNVVVTGPLSFQVEYRTQAVWNAHFTGGIPVVSEQHWCTEAHVGGWSGTTSPSTACFPVGYPKGPTVSTGSSTLPPADTSTQCFLDFNDFGIYQCSWPTAPQASGDTQCTDTAPTTTACLWPDFHVSVTSSGTQNSVNQVKEVSGAPVGVDLGSYAFVYDSQASFATVSGPVLFRTRQGGMPLPAPYTGSSPADKYFTDPCPQAGFATFGASCPVHDSWEAFHNAGNVAWIPFPNPAGLSTNCGPVPAPEMTINVIDLSLVASHLAQSPGLANNCWGDDSAPWDISGSTPGVPDGQVNVADLSWVALHLGQSFLGGNQGYNTPVANQGGGPVGQIPQWVFQNLSPDSP